MNGCHTILSETIKTHTLLIDIATRNVISLSPDEHIGEAARIMADRRISSIVIIDGLGHPIGIITERNILHAMQIGRSHATKVQELMSSPVITAQGTMTCLDAYQLCQRDGIRHLVVVDDQHRLLGMVSETDFRLRISLSELAGRRQVASVMSSAVFTLPPEADLMEALTHMQTYHDSCVVVAEAQRPVGILSERDVVRLYSSQTMNQDSTLQEIMTSPVLTIPIDKNVNEAAHQMLLAKVRHLVVVDQDGLVAGIISEHDLTHTMALSLIDDKMLADAALLRTLIEAIPDAIQFKDGHGRWLESNDAARSVFNLDVASVHGKTDVELSEIVDSRYKEALLRCSETDQHAWEQGETSRAEEIMLTPRGEQVVFDVIKVPLFHDDGSRKGLVIVGRDVSVLRRQAEIISARERELRTLTDNSPEVIIRYDKECRRIFINPAHEKYTGISASVLLGKTPTEYWSLTDDQDGAIIFQSNLQKVLDSGQAREWELTWCRPNLSTECILIRAVAEFGIDGQVESVLTFGGSISDQKQIEGSLRTAASVFDNTREAVIISDENNLILDVNAAFTQITGYSRDEVLGRNPKLLSSGRQDTAFYKEMWQSLHHDNNWRGEIWNRRKSGEIYAELLSISVIKDDAGRVQRYVAVFSDISHLKAHEAELSRIANFDVLTNLPNRRLLVDRLSQAILSAQRSGKLLVVCYMDIDGFKQVNDQYGHDIGDQLLIAVTSRLHEILRAGDTLARLGGDEFVMLFNELTRQQECLQLLDRILEMIAMPVILDSHIIKISASIGVSFYAENHEDGDTLLRQADQAMYVAKQMGKNRYHLYDAQYDQQLRALHEIRQRISQGLASNEFELFYQPKIELISNQVYGAEALIRWNHPEQGLLTPADFLSIIEGSELEIKIGEWVIENSLAQIHDWGNTGLSLEVSINISARHLLSEDFMVCLSRCLNKFPLRNGCSLQIEVLETTALEDMVKSTEIIHTCQKLGINFALDDFGTGYSSLAYLRKISVDTLKIDQSFVRDMLIDKGDSAIVQGIIALANTFALKTVAEGVETPAHIQMLIEMGCQYGQGYGISRPLSAKNFLRWCIAHRSIN